MDCIKELHIIKNTPDFWRVFGDPTGVRTTSSDNCLSGRHRENGFPDAEAQDLHEAGKPRRVQHISAQLCWTGDHGSNPDARQAVVVLCQ